MDIKTFAPQLPPSLNASQRRMVEKEQEVQTRYILDLLCRFAECYVELHQLRTARLPQEYIQP